MESNEYKSSESTALTVAKQIQIHSRKKLDPSIQKKLAALANLLPQLEKANEAILNSQAQIAADALLSPEPNVDLAEGVTKRLGERLKARTSFFYSAIRQGTPAVKVVLGLGVLLYIVLPLAVAISPFFSRYDLVFGISIKMLGLVAFSGALGSIVSIMVRLHQFSSVQTPDPAILFFTGLFKPIVGTAFALFIFAALNAGLIPVAISPDKAQYFFAALSFVAGFSERFAQDVVSKTERTLLSAQRTET